MVKKEPKLNLDNKKNVFSKYSIILIIIIGISCLIRFYYFPTEIPLTADSLYYFWYSSEVYQIGTLPDNWIPANIGWPIFVSVFFTIFDSKDIFELMQIQKILSVLISILITIPVYFLCKKFVAKKFAIIGATLIAFEPRLMINSFLGLTDPIFLLLITISLVLFLNSNKKLIYFSFVLVSLATTIRAEGLIIFVFLSVMFFIKYKKENYKIFLKYFIVLGIFMIIILPISFYSIEVTGYDGIFMRSVHSGDQFLLKLSNDNSTENNSRIINGLEIYVKYLFWIMIPNFIIFVPLGIFLIFKNRNFKENLIILSLGVMSIPAMYAYTIPALDTRYLYTLFPMFTVLSVLSIERLIGKINRSNIIIIIIILSIIFSSILFYDYKKIDYEHEKESFEVMQKISPIINGTNILDPETSYLKTIQTIHQWPKISSEIKFDNNTISINEYNSLQEFIFDGKEIGLSHIIIDNNSNRKEFLNELFFDETKYPYLKKIFDSKENGFNYHVKVFEINYELFSLK
jgi:hypothetical protein